MQLCSVEHKLNTSLTFFSSKLDSPSPMFWLEENLILSNVLITGESNFDQKNVEEVFNLCSTEQSSIHIWITCYKIRTLRESFFGLRIYAFPLQPEVGKPWPLFYRLSNLWSQELFREFELLWSCLCKIWLLKFSKFLGKVIY